MRNSRVFGDVSLTNVDVMVMDVGVGGFFGKAIENVRSKLLF